MNVDFLEKLNLSKDDYLYIEKSLGREPNELELWLFSAMYSEHCGYRHSKEYLKKLPRKNAVFYDENAGGIRIGEHAVLFKMESHNHPSAIEPFNGAATGVGGIIRDVLAMNARPIFLVDSLKFGKLDDNKTKYIFEGVIDGISSYGNCIGVPTLAGECDFDLAYTDNPLVNVMAAGIVKYDEVKFSAAKPDRCIVLLGSATMKDGIGGASFASKDLDQDDADNKISVQIAEPLMEKKLIEATLEILSSNLADACQDCGAAGILSSTSEMAAKGNCGIELHLDRVHVAQEYMLPYEIMLSETQERMMFCVLEENIELIKRISDKYEIPFTVIGRTLEQKVYRLYWHDNVVAELPPKLLSDAPFVPVKRDSAKKIKIEPAKTSANLSREKIISLVCNPSFASKEYIYSQYDYTVGARTAIAPLDKGIGAVYLHEENCYLGVATESKPHQVNLDPYSGAINTVFDAAGKLFAAGFRPLGITNCLNFANPNQSDVISQFDSVIQGMKKALCELGIGVVSGNVSFYNQTENYYVYPTPVVSMIGVCDADGGFISNKFTPNSELVLIGNISEHNFGGLYFNELYQTDETNFELEFLCRDAIRELYREKLISGCVRVTKGGVFGAVFKGLREFGFQASEALSEAGWFSEMQGRYVVSVSNLSAVCGYLDTLNLPYSTLGKVFGMDINLGDICVPYAELYDLYKNAIAKILST